MTVGLPLLWEEMHTEMVTMIAIVTSGCYGSNSDNTPHHAKPGTPECAESSGDGE